MKNYLRVLWNTLINLRQRKTLVNTFPCNATKRGLHVRGKQFQHEFKYMYLMSKVNKCVDKCIHTLLKFTRDKAFERFVKLEKGKTTGRIQRIVNRHLHSK